MAGQSYVTGRFGGTATFGAGEPNETVLSSVLGGDSMFVAKYDSGGALLWATSADGSAAGWSIGVDGVGHSYVTGAFLDTATFGLGEANEIVLTSGGVGHFVAKYDTGGALSVVLILVMRRRQPGATGGGSVGWPAPPGH